MIISQNSDIYTKKNINYSKAKPIMYTHKNQADLFCYLFLRIESGGFRLPVFEYRVRGFAVPAAGGPLQTAVPDLVVVLLRLSLLQIKKIKIK
jgi:hypothetical protein